MIAKGTRTSDITLAACLNALGVPPQPNPTPYKATNGSDFVRVGLGASTNDGKRETRHLMRDWHRGPDYIRKHPNDPFSWLQVWAKSRSAVVGASHGKQVFLARCGKHPLLLRYGDAQKWADKDSIPWQIPRVTGAGKGVIVQPGAVAALVFLGAIPAGVTTGDAPRIQLEPLIERQEDCLKLWPQLVDDHDSPEAYFAAAEQARGFIIDAIKQQSPQIYATNGPSSAIISQNGLERHDPKAERIARSIGL